MVGLRVRALRRERGWSQATLGEKAGLHTTYVGGIERGERNLSLVNLNKLAEAFAILLAELLRFPSEKNLSMGAADNKQVPALCILPVVFLPSGKFKNRRKPDSANACTGCRTLDQLREVLLATVSGDR